MIVSSKCLHLCHTTEEYLIIPISSALRCTGGHVHEDLYIWGENFESYLRILPTTPPSRINDIDK
jgi:hypothetical protein